MSKYTENLILTVIDHSQANNWEDAVKEWRVEPYGESNNGEATCVCGKEDLVYLFKITNIENGNELFPIGSSCMEKFEREDINAFTSLYVDLYQLRAALNANKYLDLSSEFFTRKILEHFYNEGVYNSERNGFDGYSDYQFMLKMFNKKYKEDITSGQNSKINGIIAYQIKPYLREQLDSKLD